MPLALKLQARLRELETKQRKVREEASMREFPFQDAIINNASLNNVYEAFKVRCGVCVVKDVWLRIVHPSRASGSLSEIFLIFTITSIVPSKFQLVHVTHVIPFTPQPSKIYSTTAATTTTTTTTATTTTTTTTTTAANTTTTTTTTTAAGDGNRKCQHPQPAVPPAKGSYRECLQL